MSWIAPVCASEDVSVRLIETGLRGIDDGRGLGDTRGTSGSAADRGRGIRDQSGPVEMATECFHSGR